MDIYTAILELKSPEQCKEFLQDICSPAELSALEQRWKTATLLVEGKTYHEIIDEMKISSVIVSRVNRVLQYGNGSLRRLILGI
ncbi:MAG: TrpR protein [Oscillospiraceae bacterium]|jgi:TrpR-related protein YerC/YecD|nr:TrpR protein [Oscillospiraceae bacterium]